MPNGQGWKPLLNVCDRRALRWYCLRNRHATMMDIATWAREYFGKSLSLNTVRRCIKKCNLKLHYANRKTFINFAQKHRRLWAQSHLRWIKRQWKCVLWQTSPHFSLFLGKTDIRCYVPMLKRTIQTVTNEKCSVMVWGCTSAHGMGNLHICDSRIAKKGWSYSSEWKNALVDLVNMLILKLPKNSAS